MNCFLFFDFLFFNEQIRSDIIILCNRYNLKLKYTSPKNLYKYKLNWIINIKLSSYFIYFNRINDFIMFMKIIVGQYKIVLNNANYNLINYKSLIVINELIINNIKMDFIHFSNYYLNETTDLCNLIKKIINIFYKFLKIINIKEIQISSNV